MFHQPAAVAIASTAVATCCWQNKFQSFLFTARRIHKIFRAAAINKNKKSNKYEKMMKKGQRFCFTNQTMNEKNYVNFFSRDSIHSIAIYLDFSNTRQSGFFFFFVHLLSIGFSLHTNIDILHTWRLWDDFAPLLLLLSFVIHFGWNVRRVCVLIFFSHTRILMMCAVCTVHFYVHRFWFFFCLSLTVSLSWDISRAERSTPKKKFSSSTDAVVPHIWLYGARMLCVRVRVLLL